jgi:hypothetical protein
VKLVAVGTQSNDIQSVFLCSYQEVTPLGFTCEQLLQVQMRRRCPVRGIEFHDLDPQARRCAQHIF